MKRIFLLVSVFALILFGKPGYAGVWDEPSGNVYWGDFHIHTEFSIDGVLGGLPEGRFAREAGEYALYCSKLDFYAVTDHAEMLTKKEYWPEAISAAQSINKIGASRPDSNGDPGIVAFTGWEWTQSGPYGHKNVILKWDDPKKLPPSPIRCFRGAPGLPDDALKKRGLLKVTNHVKITDLYRGIRYGRKDITYLAPHPKDLFKQLRKYCVGSVEGCDAIVIPHGNAWGHAPPMYTSWDLQLDAKNHDPAIQTLIEVYSKHGNSEEYRDVPPDYRYYRDDVEVSEEECSVGDNPGLLGAFTGKVAGGFAAPNVKVRLFRKPLKGCKKVCQEPNESYIPCCWRAGEITRERCKDPESEWCKKRIERARETVTPFGGHVAHWQRGKIKRGFRRRPGKTEPKDWQTCGQCRDCWQPANMYRFDGSVQKALASAYFDADGNPHHYRFGFIGSTDTHKAWGASVKETKEMVEMMTGMVGFTNTFNPDTPGWERAVNFLNAGSMVAIISPRRTRDDLWDAVKAKRVYSTSGPRMEVWARAEVQTGESPSVVDMGSEIKSSGAPTFHIRVNGAFEEEMNCPYEDEPVIKAHMNPEEFHKLCLSQCYRITDKRVPLARIEVIKILQPLTPKEAKMEKLIQKKDNPLGLIIDP